MKKKFKIKSLILSICAIALSIGLAFSGGSQTAMTHADVPSGTVLSNKKTDQTTYLTISEVVGGSKTVYLYSNGNSLSAKDLFSYYVASDHSGNESSATELIHNLGYVAFQNNVINADDDGQFISEINLSNNIIVAMKHGNINSVSASANSTSLYSSKWSTKDNPETVTMTLFAYKDGSTDMLKAENAQKSDVSNNTCNTKSHSASINIPAVGSGEEYKYTKLALAFRSSYTSAGSSTTGKNYMKITKPTIVINSNDTDVPSISVSANSSSWTNSRKINVNAIDNGSGIFKIEYKKDGGNWQVLKDYASGFEYVSSSEEVFNVTENGTYYFRAVDNVGNVSSEQTYVESNIDSTAPTIEISGLNSIYNGTLVKFNAALGHDGLSDETFTYSIFSNDEAIEEDIELAHGENTIILPKIANYTIKFFASDDVGNSIEPIEKTVSVKVDLQIESKYGYDPANLNLIYKSVDDSISNNDFFVELKYFDATGENEIEKPLNRGNYLVKYKIYTELGDDNLPKEYFGEGEQAFEITKKAVEVTRNSQNAKFSNAELNLLDYFDFSEDAETIGLSFVVSNNGNETAIFDAKTYDYNFSCSSENYEVLNGSGNFEVLPCELEMNIIKNSFIYNGEIQNIEYELFDLNGNVLVANVVYMSNGEEITPINAGEYSVAVSYNANSNYTLNEIFVIEIERKKLTVSAVDDSIIYGESVSNLGFVLSGLVDADKDNSLFMFNPYVVGTKFAVGTYEICFTQENGLTDSEKEIFKNYDLIWNHGKLVVEKKTINAEISGETTKTYGEEDGELGIYVDPSELTNGDTLDDLNFSVSREKGENVGYYNITVICNGDNYKFVLSKATYQIKKRIAYIHIFDAKKVYGDENPEFTFASSNILSNDLQVGLVRVESQNENVGTYVLSYNKALNDNYIIISESATFEIVPKEISIEAIQTKTTFGNDADILYRVSGLADGDDAGVVLSRELGNNVGEYEINFVNITNKNYVLKNFSSAKYIIEKRDITLNIFDSSKVYGEADPEFSYELSNCVEGENDITLKLERTLGEDAGNYTISVASFASNNYNLVSSNSANFEIKKADISLENLKNTEVTYDGRVKNCLKIESEFELVYKYFADGVEIEPKNAGIYEVKAIFAGDENHNSYVSNIATLTIKKADLKLGKMDDQTAVYTGSVIEYQKYDTQFNLSYRCLSGADEVAPILAGTYVVEVSFAGDENYNEWVGEYNLMISPRLVPVVIKQSQFLFDGKEKSPVFDIELEGVTKGDVYVSFVGDVEPTSVGEYRYIIKSRNELKYICDYEGTISIVYELKKGNNDASVSSRSVSMFDSSVSIFENRNANIMNRFNILRDGRRSVTAYTFECNRPFSTGEVFTVSIAAKSNNDVKIYTIDSDGTMNEISYIYADGYYILSLNDLSTNILVTESNKIMSYAKLIMTAIVLILSYAISKIIFAVHKKNFFKRTTSVRPYNEEEIKKNSELVASKMRNEKTIDSNEYLSLK